MRTKPAITLDDAKKMMAAAEAEAVRNKWEVVIAILNDGGRIVAVHGRDGVKDRGVQQARRKPHHGHASHTPPWRKRR